MDKKDILPKLFAFISPNRGKHLDWFGISEEQFIDLISKHSYNIRDLGRSTATRTLLLKRLFPDRINNSKPCNYILNNYNYKYCPKCRTVKSFDEFHSNTARHDNLGSNCARCHYSDLIKYQKHTEARRKAAKLQRTPKWADLNKIKEIYSNCPLGHHVDHIIPLQGDTVSGLHVENNLQYLLPKDNLSKGNKFIC